MGSSTKHGVRCYLIPFATAYWRIAALLIRGGEGRIASLANPRALVVAALLVAFVANETLVRFHRVVAPSIPSSR